MTRPRWTRTPSGWKLRAGVMRVDVWREPARGRWIGTVWIYKRDCMADVHHTRHFARPQTAARHALAWVRKHMGPIVEVARGEVEGFK